MKRWSIALAVLLGVGALTFSLGSPAFAASPAGASPAMTFHLSACPGSGATGNGSALFEVHQTTTIPTGVNSGDSIVLALPTGDTTPPVILMASDPANCGV